MTSVKRTPVPSCRSVRLKQRVMFGKAEAAVAMWQGGNTGKVWQRPPDFGKLCHQSPAPSQQQQWRGGQMTIFYTRTFQRILSSSSASVWRLVAAVRVSAGVRTRAAWSPCWRPPWPCSRCPPSPCCCSHYTSTRGPAPRHHQHQDIWGRITERSQSNITR